ncbi:putative metal-binding motif-containing protein [Myxococcota bacterium]|nr:putative metal-binding motif-containing protein [Myxococcota bacterium]
MRLLIDILTLTVIFSIGCNIPMLDSLNSADSGVDNFQCIDMDNDGYGDGCLSGFDCDDQDPYVYYGAIEICNGIDDDCDG